MECMPLDPLPGGVPLSLESIRTILHSLYGQSIGEETHVRLVEKLNRFMVQSASQDAESQGGFSERDVVLIAYGDHLSEPGVYPLQSLLGFLNTYLKGAINTVHILPFFPYSSDDGFSVIDYYQVRPELGTWDTLSQYKANGFKLMADAVLNHVSSESQWFKEFLDGDPRRADYFKVVEPSTDLSCVVRPRSNPLVRSIETRDGIKRIWTTFGGDQIDLDYHNPQVLLDMIDVMLHYVDRGADILRLDAIAYVWKEIGTPCINLSQTHALVKLFRAVLDTVSPWVLIITETNVPHEQNISYFGEGDEANLVYQFPLPPLVAHALLTGSSKILTEWVNRLTDPGRRAGFLNFTASHDGVGLMAAKGILSDRGIDELIQAARSRGGGVSTAGDTAATGTPYELNATYFDLLNPGGDSPETVHAIEKFLVSQAIMLALAGIPAIYFPSLFGAHNYSEGVEREGRLRAINREKFSLAELRAALEDQASPQHQVFFRYRHMIQKRIEQRAFDPGASQRVLQLGEQVFALLRTARDGDEAILALHNLTAESVRVRVEPEMLAFCSETILVDVLSDSVLPFDRQRGGEISLSPYQVRWFKLQ